MMPTSRCRVAVFSALAAALVPVSTYAMVVAEGDAPKATIVVSKNAIAPAADDLSGQKVHAAAADFQTYVQKLSGARLTIASDDQPVNGPLVLIGHNRLSEPLAKIPSGLTPSRKEEGFVIECKGDKLVLAGNDAGPYHGTEYAVSAALEQLGVRFFMPGEFGEIVPRLKSVDIPEQSLRQAPDFIMRNWWAHMSADLLPLEKRWKIHNRMNPDDAFATPADSSTRNFVADAKLTATKPELFAKKLDGTPDPFMPSLTNPEAAQIAADKMKEFFRNNPTAQSIGIAPDDGMPRDFGADAVKRNQGLYDQTGREGVPTEASISEEWMEFVNTVTRLVNKEFPDHIVTTNGYANRNTPPLGVPVDPHIGVMFAAIWADQLHAYDDPKSWQALREGQMLQEWCRLSPRVWVYGYDYTMLVSGLTPLPITRKLARNIPLMKKWGCIGFADETRNQWAECGIPTKYLRARLEWDAGTNVKATLDDFYAKWYGAAAVPSRAFWDDIEDAIEATPFLGHEDRVMPFVYTPRLLGKLKSDIEQAEQLADGERNKLHVRADRLIYEHLLHYMAMWDAEFAGKFDEAARQTDAMMAVRKDLSQISPFYLLDNEKPYDCGIWYWGVVARGEYYRKLADLTGGKTGNLVAMFPAEAQFKTDPNDEGRFAKWDEQTVDPGGWTTKLVTKPFYAQGYMSKDGYPYTGAIWYRLEADIPASAAGKPISLYCPVVETEAWCWVNGKYVGHRPYRESYERPNEIELDATTAVEPGKRNVVVIRVNTGLARSAASGGLGARVFLYSPIGK